MKKYCSNCGKENQSKSKYCYYCGSLMENDPKEINIEKVSPVPRLNPLSIVGFVLAMVSTISTYGFGVFPGIAAIIISSISLSQINRRRERGHAFAKAGLIVGILGTAISSFWGLISFIGLLSSL